MKYLKLFENWIETPKFYRKSHVDILGGSNEGEFQPVVRKQIGPESINDDLVSRGFPDKSKCVHFMSEEAYNEFGKDLSGVWGKLLYEVKIEDTTKIAWSFFLNINDWYYRSLPYDRNSNSDIIRNFEKNTNILDFEPYDKWDENNEVIPLTTDALLSEKIIGFGTIDDLKKSKNYGKYRFFAWTNDKVYLKKIK